MTDEELERLKGIREELLRVDSPPPSEELFHEYCDLLMVRLNQLTKKNGRDAWWRKYVDKTGGNEAIVKLAARMFVQDVIEPIEFMINSVKHRRDYLESYQILDLIEFAPNKFMPILRPAEEEEKKRLRWESSGRKDGVMTGREIGAEESHKERTKLMRDESVAKSNERGATRNGLIFNLAIACKGSYKREDGSYNESAISNHIHRVLRDRLGQPETDPKHLTDSIGLKYSIAKGRIRNILIDHKDQWELDHLLPN